MASDKSDNNINIPIECTDLVVFEDATSSAKEKFSNEMKKMNDELNKLSSNLMRLYTQSSTLHAEMEAANVSQEKQTPSKARVTWETVSPLIEEEGEQKALKLRFDVSQYDPSEVTVTVKNETLIVSASHEEKTDSSSMLRQYYREFKFPKGIDPRSISSTLSKDGVLTIQAVLPQLAITDDR